ncbi:MAG: LysM peptidoglycan-binding domain-containing protein [Anaerolineales bacterium]|nr:LysM peptidoglycan-binding domain-containing protein [Anaerolineales bacterium]MCB9128387.1 LysM peptidoglycan-binding domain-containing protein [Ardenticatenales bacterium]
MSQPTRGSLIVKEGTLKGNSDGKVQFMFNPTEFTVSKTNTWKTKGTKSRNVPRFEFGGGQPRELTVDLFFDTSLPTSENSPKDLRIETNKLFNFMMLDKGSQMKGKNSKMSRPPKCRLTWGEDTRHHFDCYITSCSVKYTYFNAQGVPLRAIASLSLKEARDSEALLPTNPTSRGEPGMTLHTVQQGTRLDWIAYEQYGDATQWRAIATANGLQDPLDLVPGMTLVIPPL